MNRKINLILSAQAHLPSGTGETEFEALYSKEIKPLISALDKYPRINAVFYFSGVILYWIERRHPELFMLLEDLLSRKQVEFLGGGFYAPILPLLPMSDKIGQMEMLTTYLRKQFGKRPQGCWIPAMAWEQNLVGPINSSGMNYSFLDDLQFSGAGVEPVEGIYSPCITEDQGKLITIFPLARSMGTELGKGTPLKKLEELLGKLPSGMEYPVVAIPIEGAVPFFSYEKFFEELSGADSRIEFTTPAKIYKNLRALRKVYFPGVRADPFPAGGNSGNGNSGEFLHGEFLPRQFLADHPEADGIYAKMIYVHTLINNQLRGDKTRKRAALEELWKAQDSGIFRRGSPSSPGLFHAPVRKAAYRSLLEAEKIIREKKKFTPSLSVFDYDLDGAGEFIFQDDKINCYVKSRGAGVFELDYLPAAWNYLDTLGVAERRCAFVDWLAPAKTAPEDAGTEGLKGGYFCGALEYEALETDRMRRRLGFTLTPKTGFSFGEVRIEKTWQLKKNSLVLEYVLVNTESMSQRFVFCPSVALSFPGCGDAFLRIFALREGEKESLSPENAITVHSLRGLEFQDLKNEALVNLESSRNFDLRLFHIKSGVAGMEEYQSSCLMPIFTVSLEAKKTWKASFSLKISS